MKTKVAIITVSDKGAAGEREDLSGPALKKLSEEKGLDVVFYKIVPDEIVGLVSTLLKIADERQADLILTTGGTGFSKRDVTPEATRAVVQREVPGIPEMIRAESAKITNRAYLSRGIAGIRGESLIINLPGSPKGASEAFEIVYPILSHGLEILSGSATECATTS